MKLFISSKPGLFLLLKLDTISSISSRYVGAKKNELGFGVPRYSEKCLVEGGITSAKFFPMEAKCY